MAESPRARFKPTVRARRADYTVRRHPHAETAPFIVTHHYAQGTANTSTESFGLFRGPNLVGAALWMPPTKVCAKSIDPFDWERVICLSRLAIVPGEPTNAASLFIGGMLRTLNTERRWTCCVTYADESQAHTGTIYRATNWQYLGPTRAEPRWEDAEGRQVSRLSTKTRRVKTMSELGFRMVGKYRKHKFARIFDIGLACCFVRMGSAIVGSDTTPARMSRKE